MLPGFWGPGCNLDTLIDIANIALVSRHSAENICMISKGCRTHRGVNGPMNFKKLGRFFRKIVLPGFGAAGCNPNALIDLVNTALASKISVQPKCMISEGYRTHGGVTSPMNFKKSGRFFPENQAPVVLGHLAAIQAL